MSGIIESVFPYDRSSFTVSDGHKIKLVVQADPGYTFDSWTGDTVFGALGHIKFVIKYK